jgi:hypothetical protein
MWTMSKLDRLVDQVTAFRSWAEMVQAMRQGYVPTLNGGKAASKLCEVCRRNGFRVYRLGLVA